MQLCGVGMESEDLSPLTKQKTDKRYDKKKTHKAVMGMEITPISPNSLIMSVDSKYIL